MATTIRGAVEVNDLALSAASGRVALPEAGVLIHVQVLAIRVAATGSAERAGDLDLATTAGTSRWTSCQYSSCLSTVLLRFHDAPRIRGGCRYLRRWRRRANLARSPVWLVPERSHTPCTPWVVDVNGRLGDEWLLEASGWLGNVLRASSHGSGSTIRKYALPSGRFGTCPPAGGTGQG